MTIAIQHAPILIMAGGTGGHIFPGIAVAQELRARDVPVVWLGSAGGLETQLVPRAGIAIETLSIGALRGKGWRTLLLSPLRIVQAVFAAWRLLGRVRPRCALALGGFASGPGGIAAWLRRVPLVVHEQNRIPGATNRILSHFARVRLCGFEGALHGAQWVGNPVRAEIAALPEPAQRFAERSGPLRLLVLGGSQGARALNAAVPAALAQLSPAQRPQVRHQCGTKLLDSAREAYAKAGVAASVEPFIDDMTQAYAWADFVICRSGALTLAELAAAGLGSLLVPFPFAADNHQRANALVFDGQGAALMLCESPDLAMQLASLMREQLPIENPVRRFICGDVVPAPPIATREVALSMALAARKLARPDATTRIVNVCLEQAA